ncbi:TOBE domain-containing protein, partial [Nocardioides massiliensis]
RHEVRREVRRALHEEQATALMVTHDREEALSVADQVVVLGGGRVAQAGRPEEVYRRPATAAVATLLGRASLLPVLHQTATSVVCALGEAPVGSSAAANGPAAVLVRPEQVLLTPARAGEEAAAVVLDAELLGPVWRVRLQAAEHVVEAAVSITSAIPEVGSRTHTHLVGTVHLVPAVSRGAGES